MTDLENYMKSTRGARWECDKGHPRNEANTSVQKSGTGALFLMCRVCNRERAKAWRIRNAERLTRGEHGGQVLAR